MFADDAAAFRFAELPVKRKPADAVVKALLLGESQDGVPEGPNTLAISVKRGERVYVLWRKVKVPGFAACGVGRVDEEKRQECFAKRLTLQKGYSRLGYEAQELVDDIA